jgi:hypothetical protein
VNHLAGRDESEVHSRCAIVGGDPAPSGPVNATGRVPGLLKRWVRAVDRRWFGRVDFPVCDSYGAVQARHERVLVPAAALSPRDVEPQRR